MGGGGCARDADSPWSVVGTLANSSTARAQRGPAPEGGTSQGAPIRGVDICLGNPQPKAKGLDGSDLSEVRSTERVMVNTVHDTCLL